MSSPSSFLLPLIEVTPLSIVHPAPANAQALSKYVDNVFSTTGFVSLLNRALQFLLPRREICINL